MNIVMIMSGGVGKRFGATIPKQYVYVNGKPIIDYVISAVKTAKLCDRVVCIIDKQYINYSSELQNSSFDFVNNGNTRLQSVKNGLDFIKNHYPCEKIVIVDAVAPFIYGELIDDYFNKLDDYNCVITAQHITGALSDFNNNDYDRDKFIVTQSPEAYRFNEFYNSFDVDFKYQEMAGMLGKDAKRYYNFDFNNNIKLTYDYELRYIETLLNEDHNNQYHNLFKIDKELLYTSGLKKYLLRTQKELTAKWIDSIYDYIPRLIQKYDIDYISPNQTSMYGLVLEAHSNKYGDIILKFIPEFVNRYNKEKEAYDLLSKDYMCPIIDMDEAHFLLVEKKISNANYASFDENIRLTNFFDSVSNNLVKYSHNTQFLTYYKDDLKNKIANEQNVPFCSEEIRKELDIAKELYEKHFDSLDNYVIHGDLHPLNMLDDGNKILAIDPCGKIAPSVFEYVTYIRNDVRDHKNFGYENRLKLMLDFFSKYADRKELLLAFIIHLAYTNYNSTFENDDDTMTKINCEIFDIAYKIYKNYV